jgi:transposase
MHRLQELVRLHRMGEGSRDMCRLLSMSPKTELKYRTALEAAGLLEGEATELPESGVLKAAVLAAHPKPKAKRVASSAEPWMAEIEKAFKADIGAKALWDKLKRTDASFTASYASVRRAYARLRKQRGVRAEDVVIPVETAPGDVAQVDFGEVKRLYDPATGRVRRAWFFAMVLGHSRHQFGKVVFDQKATTWVELHVEAFRFFGGVPRTIVPDNLKAAVIGAAFGAADRHELGLNRTYPELARHHGFKIDPAPVRAPKKKGKVESDIHYAKHNFFASTEAETLDEANAELRDWVMRTAGMRIHGTTGRRPLELFAEEQPLLLPLPAVPYEPVVWREASVHRDSHIEFDRRLYSVPWRTVGQKVWVRAKKTSVYVYLDDVRIATHARRGPGRRSTDEAHLPEHRGDLRHRSVGYWLERAGRISAPVAAYMQEVMDSDDVLSKLRDVQAMVQYLEQFPIHRAEAACRRASFYANYSYQGLKGILTRALDLEPLPVAVDVGHGHLERPRFARSVAELLAPTLERSDEPN